MLKAYILGLSLLYSFQTYAQPSTFTMESSSQVADLPIDGLYPNYEELYRGEVWNKDQKINVLASTTDPSGQVYIKVSKVNDSKKTKWISYLHPFSGEPSIRRLGIRYGIGENGSRGQANKNSLPKYKDWSSIVKNQDIHDFYDARSYQVNEIAENCKPAPNSAKPVFKNINEALAHSMSQADSFAGEKSPRDLLAYMKHHQAGNNHCGLNKKTNGKAFENYLNKYKEYIDQAGKAFFSDDGELNNSVFFTCMIFQESEFKNMVNDKGFSGLGQMGEPALSEARDEINGVTREYNRKTGITKEKRITREANIEEDRQAYKDYKKYIQYFVNANDSISDDNKKHRCLQFNKDSFMIGIEADLDKNQNSDPNKETLQSETKKCPILGVAASATYINIIQKKIKKMIQKKKGKNFPISNLDMYDLTAIAYNGGYSHVLKILEKGLSKNKKLRNIIENAHLYKIKNKDAFSDNKKQEILDYRTSIRSCMEKGNFNPKCGGKTWEKTRKRSLQCLPKTIKTLPKKADIPCP